MKFEKFIIQVLVVTVLVVRANATLNEVLAIKLNALSDILQLQIRTLLRQSDYLPASLARYMTGNRYEIETYNNYRPRRKKKRPTTKAPVYYDEEYEDDYYDEEPITVRTTTTKRRKRPTTMARRRTTMARRRTTTRLRTTTDTLDEEELDIQPIAQISSIEPSVPKIPIKDDEEAVEIEPIASVSSIEPLEPIETIMSNSEESDDIQPIAPISSMDSEGPTEPVIIVDTKTADFRPIVPNFNSESTKKPDKSSVDKDSIRIPPSTLATGQRASDTDELIFMEPKLTKQDEDNFKHIARAVYSLKFPEQGAFFAQILTRIMNPVIRETVIYELNRLAGIRNINVKDKFIRALSQGLLVVGYNDPSFLELTYHVAGPATLATVRQYIDRLKAEKSGMQYVDDGLAKKAIKKTFTTFQLKDEIIVNTILHPLLLSLKTILKEEIDRIEREKNIKLF